MYETREKLRDLQSSTGSSDDTKVPGVQHTDSVSHAKVDELQRDLEEQRDLAAARLTELENLNKDYKV